DFLHRKFLEGSHTQPVPTHLFAAALYDIANIITTVVYAHLEHFSELPYSKKYSLTASLI
ncbi:MAG: hypothetical protein ABW185_17295, partial [Sedimenticola sp.]